jgi:ABC-type spermidine/putrescine transport system permease subunit II
VLAAIEHREPDTVPVDLGATPSSGISAIGYNSMLSRAIPDIGAAGIFAFLLSWNEFAIANVLTKSLN